MRSKKNSKKKYINYQYVNILTQIKKYVNNVQHSLVKEKILIGLVELINQIGVGKCGGVVVKKGRINLAVNFKNMKAIKMMIRKKSCPNPQIY